MTPEEYRQKAVEIRTRAEKIGDPELRQQWVSLAKQYDQLADLVAAKILRR